MENQTQNKNGNSEADRKTLLKEFGIIEDNYNHNYKGVSRSGGHRDVHMRSIKEVAGELLNDHPGTTMFSAETVLKKLRNTGMGKTASGEPIRSANAIGDALGRHGLCLPCVTKEGKKRFLLTAIDFPEDEKAAQQEILNNLSSRELRAMPIA